MIAFKPIDEEGIQDRSYRLYWNEGQNRTDRFCQVRTWYCVQQSHLWHVAMAAVVEHPNGIRCAAALGPAPLPLFSAGFQSRRCTALHSLAAITSASQP